MKTWPSIVGFAAGVACLFGAAMGQSTQVMPPANETIAGGSSNSLLLPNYPSGTHQVIYAASELAGIPVGSVITGMQLRLSATSGTFPPSGFSASQYDVRLASSTRTPATMTTTYASNMQNPVLVRSGPLSIATNAYPGTGTPRGWGPLIPFTTGYMYAGGPLVIEWRVTSAASIVGFAADLNSTASANSYIRTDLNANATTSGTPVLAGGPVVRLTFSPPVADLARGVTKVIVPNYLATFAHHTGDSVPGWTSAYTEVSVGAASELDTIGPGSDFVGLAYRNFSYTNTWPSVPATYSSFDVQLSRSNYAPGFLSSTPASNVGDDAVTVRTGSLIFAPGSFPTSDNPGIAPYGPEVLFTNPYRYRGGPLLSVLQHSGQNSGTFLSVDCVFPGWSVYGSAVESKKMFAAAGETTLEPSGCPIVMYSVDAGTSSPLDQLSPGADAVGLNLDAARTLQTVLAASELRHIPVGSVIDSLWLRQIASAGSSPTSDVSVIGMEVAVSSANSQPAGMSTNFAANEGADRLVVRSGGVNIPANAFPSGSNGNFGKLVQFEKPFVYKGGPLCITIRHGGYASTPLSPEALFGTAAINRCVWSGSAAAAAGSYFSGGYTGMAIKLGYIPSVMTPNSLATQDGAGAWILPQISNYSVQTIIPATQLRAMHVGSLITGMSLRADSGAGGQRFPAAETVLSKFDVTIAPARNTPENISNTFTANAFYGAVTARSGPLTIPAAAFASAAGAAPNLWYVPFTKVFRYGGGDIAVTIRGSGQVGPSALFDGNGTSPTSLGASIYDYTSSNAVTGNVWGPLGIRLAFTPSDPCRADLNNDGQVDDADFTFFVAGYDTFDCTDPAMAIGCPADLDFDWKVDDADFSVFVAAYNDLLCP
ncbi:MAG: hypothetical protein U0573_02945 [Phycisphaerales bacterium]|nr:hypothetical protein [Planctomycetota bacterium]